MSTVPATIDGREVSSDGERTILEAARSAGISIPSLCAFPGLRPDGSCRLCIVEIEGHDAPSASCHTVLEPGMRVRSESPHLWTLRRNLLEWLVEAVPAAAPSPSAHGNELEALCADHDLTPQTPTQPSAPPDARHPYLRVAEDRCIACARCVSACADIQGQFVLALPRRPGAVELMIGHGDGFLDSACTACGACVDVCPTAALTDRDRVEPASGKTTRSTCGYCGVGCQIDIEADGERVLRIRGASDATVNRGHLCAKGRYAHDYHHSADRLTEPLIRGDDGSLHPISWEAALDWLASRLAALSAQHGPDSLGALTSSRSTNEAAYLLQKLFRTELGTNNVDCCARVCHASTALALRQTTGTGAASASYADIERAERLIVAGANPTEAHPVVGARLKQRVREGAPLLVIDPRRTELAEWANVHLALRPGTNVTLFHALAKLLLEQFAIDELYVAERTDGLAELRDFLSAHSLTELLEPTGVAETDARAAAAILAAGPGLFVHGLGLSELTQGTASVATLCNLGMLTGSIGRPGAGMLPLRGQNNVQGNADMGAIPNLLTGYQPVDDPGTRAHIEAIWGRPPPPHGGLRLPEMIDAAAAGTLHGLWIQGEDPVQSDPNEDHVRAALSRLDLLVVQELFPSGTTEYAHLVLPAAGALEQEGTFTNGERRIQRVRAAVAPPGRARPDWEVIRDVTGRLGGRSDYQTPSDVMDEIARVAPHLFGGVDYERLADDGLQWPCPHPGHPGTTTLHAEAFLRGRGQLSCPPFVASPELDVTGYPLTLITGRVLQQYNVGSMTRRTPSQRLSPDDVLEISSYDARALQIRDDSQVEIESRWGKTWARSSVSARMAPGTLFLSFHHPETHTNALTGPHRDPESDCPDYKVTAVRIAPA